MILLTLVLNKDMNTLCSMLEKELERLVKAKILLDVSLTESADLYIYDYALAENGMSEYRAAMQREAFYQSIVKSLQEYYFNDMAYSEIALLVERDYGYFGKAKQAQIMDITEKLLKEDDEFDCFRRLSGKKIADYLHNNKCLNISGFRRFRLKQYERFIAKLTDKTVDRFVDIAEYQEFVEVLRYFVDLNTPHAGLIHVVERGDSYTLFDETGQVIQEPTDKLFGSAKAHKEGEILISSLINLAPDRIILHQREKYHDWETTKLLENIFKEKLTCCCGCALCRSYGCLDSDSL